MNTSVIINGQPVNLPFDWNDVTVQQFICIKQNKQSFEILSMLSGIDSAICKHIDIETISLILSPVAAMLDTEIPVIDVNEVAGVKVPNNIGVLQFARKVNADSAFKKSQDEFFFLKLAAIYLAAGSQDEDILAMEEKLLTEQFVKVVSVGHKLFKNYVLLCKSESKIAAPEYEPEEIAAGIKDFQKYGVFGIVRSIALRYSKDTEEVFGWSYNRVLLELKMSADENKFERKLRSIVNRKNQNKQ